MIPFIVTVVVDLLVGLIAFSKRNNPSALALALFTASLGLWQTELFLLTVIESRETLAPWFHLTRAGMFFAPMMLALLAWRICASRSIIFRNTILIPGFIIAGLLSLLNNTVFPSVLVPTDSGYLPKPDNIYYAFVALFLFGLFGSIALGINSYRKSPQREKRRIKWLLISLVLIFSFGALSIYLVAYGVYLSKVVGAFSNAVFVSVLLYATINHHLTDIGSALSNLFARIIVLGLITILFFLALEFLESRIPPLSSKLLSFGLLILALELYPKLLRLVYPSAKRLILSGGFDVYSVTRDIQYAFKRSIETIDLIKVLDHLMIKIVRLSHYEVSVIYQDQDAGRLQLVRLGEKIPGEQIEETALEQLNPDSPDLIMVDEAGPELRHMIEQRKALACFPLIHLGQLNGIMFVGPLQDYKASYYRNDDIRLLGWLMDELPATLSRIVLHDALREDLDEAQKTMSLIELMNQYHHDIKAPLSIIDGVVSNDLYDREKQHKIILEQVARGTQLITMMSSVLRGQRERQTKPVNLRSVIEGCMLLFEREIETIEYDFAEISDVVGDVNDLKILFINLIKNAVEAKSSERPLQIRIEGGESDGIVWISFMDNGCGMSEEQIENVWTRIKSNKRHGSGVGLRAIKRIADEHGASIRIESNQGEGTRFYLRFPMRVKLAQGVAKGIEFERFE